MSGTTIDKPFDGSAMIVQGDASMAASAMVAYGLANTAMTVVEPVGGRISLVQSAEERLTPEDPNLVLERSNRPENNMALGSPSLMGGPGR